MAYEAGIAFPGLGGCSAKKYPGVMTEEESVFALEQNLFGL